MEFSIQPRVALALAVVQGAKIFQRVEKPGLQILYPQSSGFGNPKQQQGYIWY